MEKKDLKALVQQLLQTMTERSKMGLTRNEIEILKDCANVISIYVQAEEEACQTFFSKD